LNLRAYHVPGPLGPNCGHNKAYKLVRGLFQCADCRSQASITSGTIFQDTRKQIRMWFHAIWHVTNEKNGVSAMSLQRALGLKSYQTAWTWSTRYVEQWLDLVGSVLVARLRLTKRL
jgi:hypothetical protein